MKSRRILSLVAVAVLATTVFVGCGNKEAGLKDGSYKKEGAVDEKGNKATIEIEVKDGKIATVKYDEVDGEGVSKLDKADYNEKMKSVSGTNPVEAFPALEALLVEKQDVEAVDTVTGATSTTESFKALATEALADAQ